MYINIYILPSFDLAFTLAPLSNNKDTIFTSGIFSKSIVPSSDSVGLVPKLLLPPAITAKCKGVNPLQSLQISPPLKKFTFTFH